MHRDEVFGKIAIHEVAVAGVHERSFMERRTRTPDHPADQLRFRGLRIDDAPRGEHSQHSAQPHFTGHVVNRNFCETGTVRILGIILVIRIVSHGASLARRFDRPLMPPFV